MLLRFLVIPVPVALGLLLLQTQDFFGLGELAALFAPPAYLLEQQVPYGLGFLTGDAAKVASVGVLGVALLLWSSLLLCAWWVPGKNSTGLRIKLMVISLPLCAVLYVGTLGWFLWNWTT